jgi:hypothetical protein
VTTPVSGSTAQRYRILQLICWSFLFSLAIYVFVARSLAAGEAGLPGIPSFMPWVLLAVGAMALFSAPLIAGQMLRAAEHRKDFESRLAAYQQASIVAFGLRETAGIMGIVITLLTGEWLWAAGLAGAAALAMVVGWPTRSSFDRFTNPAAPPSIG